MAHYSATSKQKSYYKSLAGEWLPWNCSKSQPSRLIEKALRGEIKEKEKRVEVHGYSFTDWEKTSSVKFAIYVDYQMEVQGFDDFDNALRVARSRYPEADIIEDRNTVARYCVD